jgi:hypothetical protein
MSLIISSKLPRIKSIVNFITSKYEFKIKFISIKDMLVPVEHRKVVRE